MDKRTITKFEKMLLDNDWTINESNIIDEDNDIVKMKIVAKQFGTTEQGMGAIIMEYIDEKTPKQKNTNFDDSMFKNLLNSVLEHKGYELDIASMSFKKQITSNGKSHLMTIDEDELRTQVTNSLNIYKHNNDYKFNIKDVLVYKDAVSYDIMDKKLSHLISEMAFDNSNTSDIFFTKLYQALKITQDLDIFITLMKHFVWQIKRRITEQSTYNDIMISLFGNQGIGKSYIINAIFGDLLGGFYNSSISINNLLDERWTRALNTQFLMNIEELDAGGDRINGQTMATLKKYLTGKEATYRPMGTNTTKSVTIKASFFSTANYHIYKVLSDETGMRRFFEFTSGIERGQRIAEEDSKWLSDNALEMFKSIDEKLTKGYWDMNSEVGQKIETIQRSYNQNSAVRFLEETYTLNKKLLAKDGAKLYEIYGNYTKYCEDHNIENQFRIKENNFKTHIENVFGLDITKSLPGNVKAYLLSPIPEKINTDDVVEDNSFNAVDHFKSSRERKALNTTGVE